MFTLVLIGVAVILACRALTRGSLDEPDDTLNMTRAAAHTPPHPTARPRALVPPGAPGWVTSSLLEQTQEIWGKRSGITITPDEALAIILRVSTLLDLLSRR